MKILGSSPLFYPKKQIIVGLVILTLPFFMFANQKLRAEIANAIKDTIMLT